MSQITAENEEQQPSTMWLRDLVIAGMLACLAVSIAAGLAVWILRSAGASRALEVDALKLEIELFQEYRSLRASGADASEWNAFHDRLAKELPPVVKKLAQFTSVNRPATQKLFWVAKYRLPEMLQRCHDEPCPAEEECHRMIVESALILNYDLPEDLKL